MLSQWWIIWVGNTFPQGDAGLLRLLAARNDLGPAPSRKESTQPRIAASMFQIGVPDSAVAAADAE